LARMVLSEVQKHDSEAVPPSLGKLGDGDKEACGPTHVPITVTLMPPVVIELVRAKLESNSESKVKRATLVPV